MTTFVFSGSVRSNRLLTAKDRDDLTNALKIDPVNKFHMASVSINFKGTPT
jgi:hypothetical protein